MLRNQYGTATQEIIPQTALSFIFLVSSVPCIIDLRNDNTVSNQEKEFQVKQEMLHAKLERKQSTPPVVHSVGDSESKF